MSNTRQREDENEREGQFFLYGNVMKIEQKPNQLPFPIILSENRNSQFFLYGNIHSLFYGKMNHGLANDNQQQDQKEYRR